MADFLTDLGNFLIDNDFGTEINTDVFLDFVPGEPSSLIGLLEYDSGRFNRLEKTVDRKVQINCVGDDVFSVREEINDIYNFLTDYSTDDEGIYITSSNRIFIFNPLGTPFKLKVDEKNRVFYVLNVLITTNKDN